MHVTQRRLLLTHVHVDISQWYEQRAPHTRLCLASAIRTCQPRYIYVYEMQWSHTSMSMCICQYIASSCTCIIRTHDVNNHLKTLLIFLSFEPARTSYPLNLISIARVATPSQGPGFGSCTRSWPLRSRLPSKEGRGSRIMRWWRLRLLRANGRCAILNIVPIVHMQQNVGCTFEAC